MRRECKPEAILRSYTGTLWQGLSRIQLKLPQRQTTTGSNN